MAATNTATSPPTRADRDRRVAVARDVIGQLGAGPISLSTGSYITGDLGAPLAGGDLGPHADHVQERCDVCLLGALLLAQARLFDAVPLDGLFDTVTGCGWGFFVDIRRSRVYSLLEAVFDRRTLRLMEAAFECDVWVCDLPEDDAEAVAAAAFGRSFRSSGDRAAAIAQNVIDHDGEFVVPGEG